MVTVEASRLLVVALVCWTVPSTAGVAPFPTPLADAGSGGDAGDERSSAMALSEGAYEGNLTLRDADWFSFGEAGGLACVDVTALASQPLRFAVAAVDGPAIAGLAHEGLFSVALATAGEVALGVLPDEDPWSAASVGPYSFGVSRSGAWATGDTREQDAPPTVDLAAPAPEECFEAQFRHDGPDVDVWTFEAAALDTISASLAVGPGAVGMLEVLTPDGAVLDVLAAGELARVAAPTSGTYALRATSVDSWENADYLVGLTVGPDPSACRPYCVSV